MRQPSLYNVYTYRTERISYPSNIRRLKWFRQYYVSVERILTRFSLTMKSLMAESMPACKISHFLRQSKNALQLFFLLFSVYFPSKSDVVKYLYIKEQNMRQLFQLQFLRGQNFICCLNRIYYKYKLQLCFPMLILLLGIIIISSWYNI